MPPAHKKPIAISCENCSYHRKRLSTKAIGRIFTEILYGRTQTIPVFPEPTYFLHQNEISVQEFGFLTPENINEKAICYFLRLEDGQRALKTEAEFKKQPEALQEKLFSGLLYTLYLQMDYYTLSQIINEHPVAEFYRFNAFSANENYSISTAGAFKTFSENINTRLSIDGLKSLTYMQRNFHNLAKFYSRLEK